MRSRLSERVEDGPKEKVRVEPRPVGGRGIVRVIVLLFVRGKGGMEAKRRVSQLRAERLMKEGAHTYMQNAGIQPVHCLIATLGIGPLLTAHVVFGLRLPLPSHLRNHSTIHSPLDNDSDSDTLHIHRQDKTSSSPTMAINYQRKTTSENGNTPCLPTIV